MRAVIAHAFGEPESFSIERIPILPPGLGEVQVSIRAAAVNFVDCLVASGRYQVRPALPFVPGGEFSGIIHAVGADVTDCAVGDHICGSGLNGSYGEMLVTQAMSVSRLPDGMDFIEGATFRVGNATAMAGLVQGANLQPGETVLVLGAGGGVGYAAVGIAKALGARVIASASNEAKRALATAAGADVAIPAMADNWREQVRAAAGAGGIQLVVDPVGGEATEPAFRSLSWGGRHLVIGFANGAIPLVPTNLALVKGLRLIGVNIREFNLRHPQAGRENMKALNRMWEAGKLRPAPVTIYPLSAFAEAMRKVARRDTVGRVVLDVGGAK